MDGTSSVPPKIHKILNKVVSGNIENFEVCVHDPNKKGQGFLGEISFISLKEKDNCKQLHFAVKQALSEKRVKQYLPIRDLFFNEIYTYRDVLPKLQTFQERIPKEYHFHNIAKCVGASSEENFEWIVLENLKYDGFVMHDKTKPLDEDTFKFILKTYGRFHAMSFAYQASCPEEFSQLVNGCIDTYYEFCHKPHFYEAIKFIHRECLESLQPGVDDAVIKKYRKYMEDGVELFGKSFVNGRYTCFTHADCWSNNMMFKYDNTGNLIDLRLLDLQMARIGSPIWDISYCLYTGGTKEIYDDLDNLLQVYYDSLSQNLRAYGHDPEKLCPFETLKSDWKVYCQLPFVIGLLIWRLKLTYDDSILDFTDLADDGGSMMNLFKSKYDVKAYKERSRDIILHLYENDYLF